MHKLFSLIKVQLKMNLMAGMSYKTKKGRDLTLLTNVAIILILAGAFLPLIISSVLWLHEGLALVGMQNLIVQAGVVLATLVIMIFGTLSVLETFYYANDVDYLLPLPLKSTDLIIAKFSVALVTQYVFLALFYFPIMIVFGVLESAGVLFYVLMTVLFFLIPIFPTVLLCILLMIFMGLTSIGKNRDLIRAIFMFLIVIVSSFGGAMMGTQLDGVHVDLAAMMEMPAMRVISWIFRPVMMGVNVILNPGGEVLTLLLFIAIVVASLVVFLAVAKVLYLPTIVGYADGQSKNEVLTASELNQLSTDGSIFKTLLGREFKHIMRTPMFALNCFVIPFLMPIVMVVAGIFGGGGLEEMTDAVGELHALGFLTDTFIARAIGIMFAVLYFMTSYNTTALSSFSREGKTIGVWKYLPIKISDLIKAKLTIAVFFNALPMLLTIIGIVFLTGLSIFYTIILMLFMFVSLVFVSLLFLFFDLNFPRLNWDSEQQAMKGGITQVILTFANMAVAVGIGFMGWFMSNVWIVVMLGLLVPLGATLVLVLILQKKGQKLFDRMG